MMTFARDQKIEIGSPLGETWTRGRYCMDHGGGLHLVLVDLTGYWSVPTNRIRACTQSCCVPVGDHDGGG
jgi:hypothetical protein